MVDRLNCHTFVCSFDNFLLCELELLGDKQDLTTHLDFGWHSAYLHRNIKSKNNETKERDGYKNVKRKLIIAKLTDLSSWYTFNVRSCFHILAPWTLNNNQMKWYVSFSECAVTSVIRCFMSFRIQYHIQLIFICFHFIPFFSIFFTIHWCPFCQTNT